MADFVSHHRQRISEQMPLCVQSHVMEETHANHFSVFSTLDEKMTTSEILPGAENEPLDATASQLAYLVESFLDLGVLVHDNQGTPQSHSALTRKTNQVVSQLSGLTNSPFTQQYPIPVDVITYIEDGRNPDIYSREFVEVTAKSNARLKGKMLAFRRLSQVLGGKLVEEFPHLKDAVENIESRTIKSQAASGV